MREWKEILKSLRETLTQKRPKLTSDVYQCTASFRNEYRKWAIFQDFAAMEMEENSLVLRQVKLAKILLEYNYSQKL